MTRIYPIGTQTFSIITAEELDTQLAQQDIHHRGEDSQDGRLRIRPDKQKDYDERFLIQGKPIVKLGVNFDAELHAQHHRLEDTGRWPRFCRNTTCG